MELLIINEDKVVELNKIDLLTIPEFKALITRDKGSTGDYRGEKKLKATKEFTFIYHYCSFLSTIRDWDDAERRKEALYYAGLKEEDIDDVVMTANQKYFEMQVEASRPLRTLKALYKGLDAMDDYFEGIDFSKTDKQGKLLNDPLDFTTNVSKLDKMYDAIRNFEKRVESDLAKKSGIRGPNSQLGDTEGQKKPWSELEVQQGSEHVKQVIPSSTSFTNLLEITRSQAKKERHNEQLAAAVANPNLREIFDKFKEGEDTE